MPPPPSAPPPPAEGLRPGTPLLLAASCSSLSIKWDEAAQVNRVLEYQLMLAPVERLQAGGHREPAAAAAASATGHRKPSPRATALELTGLVAGTNYSIVARARTSGGWGPESQPLIARTMRPQDFPLPLPAPVEAGLVGCDTMRLQLPVLRSCSVNPAPHWDLQWLQGGGGWRVLQPRTEGGQVVAVGMDPYAASRVRLVAYQPSGERSVSTVSQGQASRLLLGGSGTVPLLKRPTAEPTSSASVHVRWDRSADPCRPSTRWEMQFSRPPAATPARLLMDMSSAPKQRRSLLAIPPLPRPPRDAPAARRLGVAYDDADEREREAGELAWRQAAVAAASTLDACDGALSADQSACCSSTCGSCGGSSCSNRLGGAAKCCPGWREFESEAPICQLVGGTRTPSSIPDTPPSIPDTPPSIPDTPPSISLISPPRREGPLRDQRPLVGRMPARILPKRQHMPSAVWRDRRELGRAERGGEEEFHGGAIPLCQVCIHAGDAPR